MSCVAQVVRLYHDWFSARCRKVRFLLIRLCTFIPEEVPEEKRHGQTRHLNSFK